MLCPKLPVAALAPLLAVTVIACGSSKTVGGGGGSTQINTALALTAIAVNPSDASVPAGLSARFTATGSFSDGSSQEVTGSVTWTAADSTCASARSDVLGAFDTYSVCATTITAKDAATGVSGTASLTLVNSTLQSIAIAPIGPTLLVGTTLKLTVSGLLSDGSSADLTLINWQSSDPTVADIGNDGTVLAIKAGTTTITATEPTTGFSDTTTVTVTIVPGMLSYVSLSPGSVIGGGARTVVGTVALDSPAAADKTITLTSSSAAAVVNPTSIAIAAGASTGTFQVTTSAVTKRTKVTITATSSDSGDPTKTAALNVRVAH